MAKMGLVAAMESEREAEAAREQSEQIELPAAVDSLETQMLEVQETVRKLEERVEAIDEAIEDTEVLERVKERMEESVEEGGMSADTAEMAEIAVESIKARLGVSGKAFSGVSMESFGNKATRIGATKLGLEDVKENLKKAWDAIIAALQKAYEWVIEFLKDVFTAHGRLKKRAEIIKAAARSATGDAASKTVKAGSIANSLSMGGKFAADDVVKGVENAVAVAKTLGDNVDDLSASFEGMNGFIKDGKENVHPIAKFDFVGWKSKNGPKNMIFYRSPELPGNRQVLIVVRELKLGETTIPSLDSVKVGPYIPEQAKLEIEEIAVADTATVAKIADEVIAGIKTLEANKAKIENMSKKMKELSATLKAQIGKNTPEVNKSISILRREVAGMTRVGVQMASGMNSVVLSVGKSAMDYAELSLKQYPEASKAMQKALGKAEKAAA